MVHKMFKAMTDSKPPGPCHAIHSGQDTSLHTPYLRAALLGVSICSRLCLGELGVPGSAPVTPAMGPDTLAAALGPIAEGAGGTGSLSAMAVGLG